MFSLRIDSAYVKVSVAIGATNVVDWKDIEQTKERDRERERERIRNADRREQAYAVGLPLLARKIFDDVVDEIERRYNEPRSNPGSRSRVQYARNPDDSVLDCVRTDPHEATLTLAFLGGPDGDKASATFEVYVSGVDSSGQLDGARTLYKVYCNPNGVFFFENIERGGPSLSADQVRAEFMKKFAYYLL